MAESYEFIIEQVPPSVNRIYRFNRRYGNMYKTKEAKDFQDKYILPKYKGKFFKTEKVKLSIIFVHNRDRDIDNILKVLLDSFQKIIYENDKQVYELNIKKVKRKGTSFVKVKVEELPPEAIEGVGLI